jgi:hypothetical protein
MARTTTQINVSIEVYKLIEQNRHSFEDTHDDILKRLLKIPVSRERAPIQGELNLGCGVSVPFGTLFRKEYKRKEYIAEAKEGGIWVNGRIYPTLNQATNAVSNSNQNAWLFWEVKRPQDSKWIPIDDLRVKITSLSTEDLADFPED